jgi:hypothetical protein
VADRWEHVRHAAFSPAPNFGQKTAKVILQEYEPMDYLLSHCTIIASVDTEPVNQPLGRSMVDGFQIDRKYADYYVTPQTSKFVNNNNDCWERKLLMACFKTFIGAENYVEHIQIPELSKGKIIDAAARNIGESLYVDILIATSRRHKPLVEAITSGKIGTLSMGCSVEFTTCTKCGNVAEDETHLCPHIRYFKGSDFVDEFGNKRKIAELCGHAEAEPGSVKFIEASWVANPAFTGAVLRSILNADEIEGLGKKLQVAFSQGPRSISDLALLKAARSLNSTPNSNLGAFVVDDFEGLGQKLGIVLAHPVDHTWGNDFNFFFAEDQGQAPAQDSGDSGAPPPAPAKKEEDPLHKAVTDLADVIREHAVAQVRKEIGKDEAGRLNGTPENQNDTLIKSAFKHPSWRKLGETILKMTGNVEHTKKIVAGLVLHKRGGWQAVKAGGFTGVEVLAISRALDRIVKKASMAGESRVYQTVIAVGGTAPYADVETYLAACRQVLGRPVSGSESGALLEKGRLFSLGS